MLTELRVGILKEITIKNDLMGKILYAPNYDGTVTVMQMKNIN